MFVVLRAHMYIYIQIYTCIDAQARVCSRARILYTHICTKHVCVQVFCFTYMFRSKACVFGNECACVCVCCGSVYVCCGNVFVSACVFAEQVEKPRA